MQTDIIEASECGQLTQLPELTAGNFNLIHSSRFVGFNPDPELGLYKSKREELELKLIEQLKPLLAVDGVMDLGLLDRNGRRVIIRK